jgi:osmotically-inducible protein OsmY
MILTLGFSINCSSITQDTPDIPPTIHQSENSLITAEVTSALMGDPELKGHAIHVETHEGQVVLEGIVQNRLQSQRAERIAREVIGVTSVRNSLQVQKGR